MEWIPELLEPGRRPRGGPLPALGLLPGGSLEVEQVIGAKAAQGRQVHVVFPVGSPREAGNLRHLLHQLRPLQGRLIDALWLAFGGRRPGELSRLPAEFPGLKIFPARSLLPPDQVAEPGGKGATMRAFLYDLVVRQGVTHPRTVVAFLDADIRPPYFSPRWVVDPVGAVVWFEEAWGAKVVYHRPRGGRLNTMVRALVALCPHPGVQSLQKLAYILSGEMAGTLRLWTALPFKSGYGVELLILLTFALNRLGLSPGRSDLHHLVQVYLGQMDHRHAPLTSTARRRGLDQMAGAVFHTLLETLAQEGILDWSPGESPPHLALPLPPAPGDTMPRWLTVTLGDATLPPLATLPEVRKALEKGA
jgi:hypothetical protein